LEASIQGKQMVHSWLDSPGTTDALKPENGRFREVKHRTILKDDREIYFWEILAFASTVTGNPG
jgi:hypothetical protein